MESAENASHDFARCLSRLIQGPRKGEDDRHKLKVALEDLYNGKTCRLAVTRNKARPDLRTVTPDFGIRRKRDRFRTPIMLIQYQSMTYDIFALSGLLRVRRRWR